MGAGYFTIPNIELATCRGLVPLVGINVLGLIFNTFCLQYVDASFYQVARGLVLPFTVLFSFLLLSSRSSSGALFAVSLVCSGFLLGVWGEHLHTSALGTALGVFSSLTTSVHAIVVKRSLSVVQGSTMDLVYYNNLLSALLLGPLVVLSGEGGTVSEMAVVRGSALRTFLAGAAVTGVFGFLICIAGFLSIKVTSPVTHMVSSAVRGVIQTFLGMWCFGDVITAWVHLLQLADKADMHACSGRGFGILFILLGSTVYTYVKDRESRAREAIASHGRPPTQPLVTPTSPNKPIPLLSTTPPVSPAGKLGIDAALANSGSDRCPDSGVGVDLAQSGMQTPSRASSACATADGVSVHHLSPSANGSTPRTPSRRLSFDARQTDSGHGRSTPSTPGNHGLARGLYATPPPRLAFMAQHQQSHSKRGKKGDVGHQKSFSVTDLKDILIAPNNTPQRGAQLYPTLAKEAKVV